MTQQTIPRVNIENIHDPNEIISGQSQETRIYYRPVKDKEGNPIWIPTTPLPADAWHMNYYSRKGFRTSPPSQEQESNQPTNLQASEKAISCPVEGCHFIAKTYIGLARHMRSKHDTK